MRMPIFSYFIVMGTLLAGLLIWISNVIEPEAPVFQASQIAGVPKFKPEPEPAYATITAVNFAAKPAKVVAAAERPKAINRSSPPRAWNRFAEYPNNNLSIH
jgi:hypothetical protein